MWNSTCAPRIPTHGSGNDCTNRKTQGGPQYTDKARLAGYKGAVYCRQLLRREGTVDIIRVVCGLPFGLSDSAIQAVKQWQFKPNTKDGQGVDIAVY